MRRKGIVLACLLATAGCYKATFLRDTNAVRGVERDKWADFRLVAVFAIRQNQGL